ncbi:MAG: hypothetical protein AB7S90_15815 [Marinobacterium sp.]
MNLEHELLDLKTQVEQQEAQIEALRLTLAWLLKQMQSTEQLPKEDFLRFWSTQSNSFEESGSPEFQQVSAELDVLAQYVGALAEPGSSRQK